MKTLLIVMIGAVSMLSFKTDSTTGYDIGAEAIDFSLKNATNNINGINKNVSLKDFKNAKGYIVIFTCNHCPFSVAYEDRIIDLHNKYAAKGYPVIAINPNAANKQPSDSFANMKKRAVNKKFPFAYLYDESQEIALAYGARRTPHVYILEKKGSKNIVKFIGAIDDKPWDASKAKSKYVENAVDALLTDKPVEKTKAKAVGCTIKWAD